MKIGETFRIASEALRVNRLRSALTMLGVVIGVTAVVALVSIGAGARDEVESQIEGLGSNIIFVVPGRFEFGAAPSTSRLRLEDIEYLGRVVGDPRRVAVTVSSGETVRSDNAEVFATIQGTNENVPNVFNRPLDRGRYVSEADVEARRRVAVLGSQAADRLFRAVDPIGRQITVAGVRFRVIGVFEEVGTAFGVTVDDEVHIPVTAAQRLFGQYRIDGIAVKAASPDDVPQLQRRLVAALEDKYEGQEFSAVTQTQLLGAIGDIFGLLTGVLAAIAGISLLVGGVGVSNIMMVSVRERTREIGLRKALGARQRDVLAQFLIEAVLLTTIGGIIGIALGIGVALGLRAFSPVPATVEWWAPALAFGVSVVVGVFFGVVPARSAGRLDPVVALRSE